MLCTIVAAKKGETKQSTRNINIALLMLAMTVGVILEFALLFWATIGVVPKGAATI
jgi:hypothetical protein